MTDDRDKEEEKKDDASQLPFQSFVTCYKEEEKKSWHGLKAFMTMDNRDKLPFQRPAETPPFWKIISKFIGKDLTRVSLPVFLNEP